MVAEHGEENPFWGGPGIATGGIEIPVEATGEPPAPGGAPQAQVPVEPGGIAAGPAAAAATAAPAAGAAPTLYVLGQQGLGSQAAFARFDFGPTFGGQQQQQQQQPQ